MHTVVQMFVRLLTLLTFIVNAFESIKAQLRVYTYTCVLESIHIKVVCMYLCSCG